jgi:hypothetical protein
MSEASAWPDYPSAGLWRMLAKDKGAVYVPPAVGELPTPRSGTVEWQVG